MIAAEKGNPDVVKLLLDAIVDEDDRHSIGITFETLQSY